MIAATRPRAVSNERLLVLDPASGDFTDAAVADLPRFLRRGDLVVVNDAATIPASLYGTFRGAPIELRLAGSPHREPDARFTAVLFGAGDWQTKTENRPSPPRVGVRPRRQGGIRWQIDVLIVPKHKREALQPIITQQGLTLLREWILGPDSPKPEERRRGVEVWWFEDTGVMKLHEPDAKKEE